MFFPPILSCLPFLHGFLTPPPRSVQIWGVNGPICRGFRTVQSSLLLFLENYYVSCQPTPKHFRKPVRLYTIRGTTKLQSPLFCPKIQNVVSSYITSTNEKDDGVGTDRKVVLVVLKQHCNNSCLTHALN